MGLVWLFISLKQRIFALTAVAVIFAANLDSLVSFVNYLLFVLIVLSLFFLLILIYVVQRERSQALMEGLFNWLKKHAQTILIGVLLVFRLYSLIVGITGLAG